MIGSANLTGGLATHLEAGVLLTGERVDSPIATAWTWAETLWTDARSEPWVPGAAEAGEEPFDELLYRQLHAEVARDPVFITLGRSPRRNWVVDLTPLEVHVETDRSRVRVGGAEAIPAWIFNLAWDRYLGWIGAARKARDGGWGYRGQAMRSKLRYAVKANERLSLYDDDFTVRQVA